MYWMARSTEPVAKYHARSPSAALETCSVSARTVAETERAIAARAAESHSVIKRALPRWHRALPRWRRDRQGLLREGLLIVIDVVHLQLGDPDRRGHLQRGKIRNGPAERHCLDANCAGEHGQIPRIGPGVDDRSIRTHGSAIRKPAGEESRGENQSLGDVGLCSGALDAATPAPVGSLHLFK